MSDLALYPTSIPCGFCEAPTALERDQVGDLSIGHGCCSECRHLVLSVAGPSDAVYAFLDRLESVDFPSEKDVWPPPFIRPQASCYQGSRL